MATHVFAVWDFMALAKTLQQRLTCVESPWFPVKNGEAARLINEIVLAEETDEVAPGRYASHFEVYRQAMQELGVPTDGIDHATSTLQAGGGLDEALRKAPTGAARFVRATLAMTERSTHEVAAAFVFGREQLVPAMFERVLASVGDRVPTLRWYLARHIEVDGGDHGPKAERLLVSLCGDDSRRWDEALEAARSALVARQALWDSLVH